jgi:hypothetical protein
MLLYRIGNPSTGTFIAPIAKCKTRRDRDEVRLPLHFQFAPVGFIKCSHRFFSLCPVGVQIVG